MAAGTKIAWTDYTFNPWWGCARQSAGCQHCYAETLATRYGHALWGRNAPRRVTSEANWRTPLKWNRAAEAAGVPARVFCASMGDVFEDHPDLDAPRARLWDLVHRTSWLRWQLLTKRPENIHGMVPRSWISVWPSHVWVGATVEAQRFLPQRAAALCAVPAGVRFLSCEPLISGLDLRTTLDGGAIGWVIVGGESGAKARHFSPQWAAQIVEDCRDFGVPVFVKQMGTAWARDTYVGGRSVYAQGDRSGEDPSSWPNGINVRQFPACCRHRFPCHLFGADDPMAADARTGACPDGQRYAEEATS